MNKQKENLYNAIRETRKKLKEMENKLENLEYEEKISKTDSCPACGKERRYSVYYNSMLCVECSGRHIDF